MKTQVREVFHKGDSSIVEWTDDRGYLQRAIVPVSELKEEEGLLYVENPEEGAPYGEIWEDLIHTEIGPKGIANLLRLNGIWTVDDLYNNTRTVTFVFREAASTNQQRFMEAVRTRR